MKLKTRSFWAIWLVDITLFLLILVIPKNELLYRIFYVVFIITAGIFPLVSFIYSLYAFGEGADTSRFKVATFPVAAALFTTLMTYTYFIRSLVSEKRAELIMASSAITLGLLSLAAIIKFIKHPVKRVVLLLTISLLLYLGFIYYCINLSYDYSIIW